MVGSLTDVNVTCSAVPQVGLVVGMSIDPIDPFLDRSTTDRAGSIDRTPPIKWRIDPIGRGRGVPEGARFGQTSARRALLLCTVCTAAQFPGSRGVFGRSMRP